MKKPTKIIVLIILVITFLLTVFAFKLLGLDLEITASFCKIKAERVITQYLNESFPEEDFKILNTYYSPETVGIFSYQLPDSIKVEVENEDLDKYTFMVDAKSYNITGDIRSEEIKNAIINRFAEIFELDPQYTKEHLCIYINGGEHLYTWPIDNKTELNRLLTTSKKDNIDFKISLCLYYSNCKIDFEKIKTNQDFLNIFDSIVLAELKTEEDVKNMQSKGAEKLNSLGNVNVYQIDRLAKENNITIINLYNYEKTFVTHNKPSLIGEQIQ